MVLFRTKWRSNISKEVLPLWEGLKQRSVPRGNPKAAGIVISCQKDQADQSNSKTASNSAKELYSLAQRMPNLSDIDVRTLALRIP